MDLLSFQAWYNSDGFHSMPTYVNAVNNAILRANLPSSKEDRAKYGKIYQCRFSEMFSFCKLVICILHSLQLSFLLMVVLAFRYNSNQPSFGRHDGFRQHGLCVSSHNCLIKRDQIHAFRLSNHCFPN